MKILKGKSVYQDICKGPLYFFKTGAVSAAKRSVEDKEEENRRFVQVRHLAAQQILELHAQAVERVGVSNAYVFEVQRMLLEDPEFVMGVEALINNQGLNLEYAIKLQAENMEKLLSQTDDDYLKERARDVQDVSNRLLRILGGEDESWQGADSSGRGSGWSGGDNVGNNGGNNGGNDIEVPSIIVADDLLPSETVQLPRDKVLGLIMRKGSLQSHTAIFARSMGIPAVVGIGENIAKAYEGAIAVVDGYEGMVYLEPDQRTEEKLRLKKEQSDNWKKGLLDLIGQENETKDGKKIKILANAGTLEDVERAVLCDAGGIGLLRSEILYLGKEEAPDEEMQFAFYKSVLEKMGDKEVVVRTLDVGADKELSYLNLAKEENPALGLRGIRIGLTQPELLKTQLRALYRASVYGKLAIMYPMITSVTEVKRIRVLEAEVRWELEKEGIILAQKIPTGIMIETPAAAILSEDLAKEVDFFSVGTNDLAQYALALDRQNECLAEFDDLKYKAVLKLIEMACENAHRAGIPIGICGELASDYAFTEHFIKMGMDELSVSPEMILSLRQHIRNLTIVEV